MRRRLFRSPAHFLLLFVAFGVCGACGGNGGLRVYDYRVVNTYAHDPLAYSQGLLFHAERLYESTGRNGTSSVRRVVPETGYVEKIKEIPTSLFAEGLALHDGELYQLTWTSGKANVFDLETFAVKRNYDYEGEGWGLTSDGTHLIMSNGTDVLSFRDPATFAEVRSVRVEAEGISVERLNELEWIDGEVWANVWKQDYLVRIDPATGVVTSAVDLRGIYDYSQLPDAESVLNGIAWDAQGKRLFVTGKLWPSVFEIEVVPRP